MSFGLFTGDLSVSDIHVTSLGMTAQVILREKVLGTIKSPLVGEFNIANILAAMGMALAYGISFSDIARAVESFRGIGRRFEYIGTLSGAMVYSDYAHHPTALRVATEAIESKFGKGNTLVIFQSHQIDRTKKLRTEFEDVFREIPHLYLPEIYFVPGREHAGDFSARLLAESVNTGRTDPVRYYPTLDAMSDDIFASAKNYKAILFIGAGDIDRYARTLLSRASHP
jgi:UDP-N-acetylmuramate--alanine ligase